MVVADGEDVAMVRATLVDANGASVLSASADHNITFAVESGTSINHARVGK